MVLTQATTPVDAPPQAVMLTIGEVAERDKVSKQAVSKKARRLADEQGLLVDRDEQGRIQKLNVVQYDLLRGRFDDPSKAQRPAATPQAASPSAPQDPSQPNESYNEALRQKTWHEAERRRLEVAELKGELIRVSRVAAAVVRCGEEIVRVIDRLPNAADDLAAAVARDGSHGLRVGLKQIVARMRTDLAKALTQLATLDQQETAAAQQEQPDQEEAVEDAA